MFRSAYKEARNYIFDEIVRLTDELAQL